jgi:hypothetical protein
MNALIEAFRKECTVRVMTTPSISTSMSDLTAGPLCEAEGL